MDEARLEQRKLAMVLLGPALVKHGLEGKLLGAQAAKVYDAAVDTLVRALTLPSEEEIAEMFYEFDGDDGAWADLSETVKRLYLETARAILDLIERGRG